MVNLKYGKWFVLVGCWTPILLMLAGCSGSETESGLSALGSTDTKVRIMGIKWAGDNKVWSAVPALTDCLQHEDKSVRFYSIEALRRITGTDHGYDYKAAPHVQAESVKRWREFIESDEYRSNANKVKNE